MLREVLGVKDEDLLDTMVLIGNTRFDIGRYDVTENIYQEVLRNLRQFLGPDHSRLLVTMIGLGAL